ncbi:MAG: hypothetical protein GWO20_04975, partial [Candidatus Korarchaeota archaeon]|nr:hypothetical protein [Candidatus Korarchaeota archaeon]
MTVDTSHLSAVEIIVPIKQDIKKAVTTAGNLISASARSFELVWDRSKNRLAFWLVSHKNDIEHYVETFKSVYPNAAFSRLDHNVPRWFDPENQVYQVFDVSVRHGHFFAVMDYQKVPVLITQISNTIQMAEYGWIQFVFAKYDLATRYMNQLSRRLDSMYQKVTNNKHLSLWEMILYQNRKPHEHPEFHGDFARNYKTLKQHIQTKTVNPQLIMSVRGLVKSDNDDEEVGGVVNDELDFGFDVIENLSMENIHTTFEHCTKNPYENYYKFYRDRYDDEDDLAEIECRPVNKLKKKTKPEYIRIGGKKKKRGKDGNQTLLQRISIFPLRLLPEPEKPLTQAVERYVGTNIFGSYHKRRPLPFLLLNTSEMPLFVHLPDNTVQHLRLTRGQTLPRTDNDKNGFRLGLFNIDKKGEENGIKNENDSNSNHSYGEIVSSNDIGGVVVHPDDLTR